MKLPAYSLRHAALIILLMGNAAHVTAEPVLIGDLPRRADLAFATDAKDDGLLVKALVAKSPAEKAGLRNGDKILLVDGVPVENGLNGEDLLRRVKGGVEVNLEVVREGKARTITFTPAPLAQESVPGLDSVYGSVEVGDDVRLRTIITRPTGVEGPLPAIFFTQWVSCGTVELTRGGLSREILKQLALQSGAALVRVERAGTGDSEGQACHALDYDTEVANYRTAYEKIIYDNPLIDPERVVVYGSSLGSTTAPLVAAGQPVAGVMVQGGGALTYLERMINFDRQNLERTGVAPEEMQDRMVRQIEFNVEYLARGRKPEDIAADSPEMATAMAGILGMEGGLHYARPYAWHQQAAQKNFAAAWASITAPVLVIFGEFDQWEGRHGHELIVDVVNRAHPGNGTLVVIPQMDHDGDVYDNIIDAYTWKDPISGPPEQAHRLQTGPMLRWLRTVAFRGR